MLVCVFVCACARVRFESKRESCFNKRESQQREREPQERESQKKESLEEGESREGETFVCMCVCVCVCFARASLPVTPNAVKLVPCCVCVGAFFCVSLRPVFSLGACSCVCGRSCVAWPAARVG